MKDSFISVVPAVRTPYGVDVFDYRVAEDADVRVGDLLRVPFRKREITALILRVSHESAFADKATLITPEILLRLGSNPAELLQATSSRTFTSMPTVLSAWIRNVPKRASLVGAGSPRPPNGRTGRGNRAPTEIWTANRFQSVLAEACKATGRVLILTPWQHRAERYASELRCSVLHAALADGAAWNAWNQFASVDQGILVTTRLGAWLASVADTVIIDEPENDDFKQDELAPRFDSRWMVQKTREIDSHLCVIQTGTTPPLQSPALLESQSFPNIDVELTLEPWQRNGRSDLPGLSPAAVTALEEAVEEKHPVIILHPVHGDRSRIHCRECKWTMTCGSCEFPLTAEQSASRCRRCGRRAELPATCPNCGGADLNAARQGKDRLAAIIAERFGSAVQVADLRDWHRLSLHEHALIIVTDLSLIGGYAEDIRRRERLVIAWRRLAALVGSAKGMLYVLGPENTLSDARSWLTSDGLKKTWNEEFTARKTFAYPPAQERIKALIDGDIQAAERFIEEAKALLPDWTVEGPYPIEFRAKTRKSRHIVHLIPSEGSKSALEPLARKAIIDLDPIAFFS